MIEVERIWETRESKDLKPTRKTSKEIDRVLSTNAGIYQGPAEEIIRPTQELLRYEGMIKKIEGGKLCHTE
jgi:hypothetical protein